MTPKKVKFTGLEFDPDDLRDRWHRGVIPLDWPRYRFLAQPHIQNPISLLNRWLFTNIEGKWAVYIGYADGNTREVTMAFENDFDGITFVLANGKDEAFINAEPSI